MQNIKSIQISPKYGGGVTIKAIAENGQVYIIEREDLESYILKAIAEKGYKEDLKPRQVYPRLIINQ